MGMSRRFAPLTLVLLMATLAAPLALWAQAGGGAGPAVSAPQMPPAEAAKKGDGKGVVIVLLLMLFMIWLLFVVRLLTVIVSPDFTRRCARIFSTHWGYALLWGLAAAGLVFLVALVLGSTGQAGANVAGLLLLAVVVMGCVGAAGVTLPYGERLLKRDGIESPSRPLLSMIAGNVVSSFLFAIPCVGQILLLLMLVVGLGAAIQAWCGRGKAEQPEREPTRPAEPGGCDELPQSPPTRL